VTQLYRHFDGEGRLLYIGISSSVSWRLMAHEKNAGWWKDVRTVTISAPYITRVEALAAEAAAIRDEHPMWNQQHVENPATPPLHQAHQGKGLLKRLRARQAADGNTSLDRIARNLAELKSIKL
jgi:predicted GIY-YIG superfamily endonuclease